MTKATKTDPQADRTCVNCHWWREEHDSSSEERYGICRRFPPAVMVSEDGLGFVQPWTGPADACGEHKASQ